MSNNNQDWYDDDDDFDTEDEAPRSADDVVKKLRKAERTQSKRVKELEAELESLRKFQREAVVSKVLQEKGVNPKIAAFIPSTLDTTPEALSSWLDEYGDVFGVVQQSIQSTVNPMDLAALRQIDNVTAGALAPNDINDTWSALNNAQSTEEILAMIFGAED